MIRVRTLCWLSHVLVVTCVTACETSPASSGPVDEDASGEWREPFDAEVRVDADDAGAAAHDADAFELEANTTMPSDTDASVEVAPMTDASFSLTPRDGGPATDARAQANGETLFVSVGGEDNTPWLYTSCDGRAWTRRTLELPPGHPTLGEGAGLRGVGYGAGTFVITGGGSVSSGNARLMGRSVDGVTWEWEQRPLACGDCQWIGGAALLDDGHDRLWIAGGGTGARLYSRDDGKSWQTSSGQGMAPYRRFRSLAARAVGAGQGLLTIVEFAPAGSSEPVLWRDSAQPIGHESVFIAAGNGTFVAVWYDDGCRYLPAGATSWRSCDLPEDRDPVITSVVFGDGKFSILGHGAPIESVDGEHWTMTRDGDGSDFRDVAHAAGSYATPRLHSRDGADWESADPSAEQGTAVAVGALGNGLRCPR